MTTLLDLERALAAATPGPWKYEPERYSARCVIGIKPRDDRWLAHFQPEMQGEENGQLVVLVINTLPDLLAALTEDELREIEAAYAEWRDAEEEFSDGLVKTYRNVPRLCAALREAWREIESHKKTGRARDILGGGMIQGIVSAENELEALRSRLAAAEAVVEAVKACQGELMHVPFIGRVFDAVMACDAQRGRG